MPIIFFASIDIRHTLLENFNSNFLRPTILLYQTFAKLCSKSIFQSQFFQVVRLDRVGARYKSINLNVFIKQKINFERKNGKRYNFGEKLPDMLTNTQFVRILFWLDNLLNLLKVFDNLLSFIMISKFRSWFKHQVFIVVTHFFL